MARDYFFPGRRGDDWWWHRHRRWHRWHHRWGWRHRDWDDDGDWGGGRRGPGDW